MAEDDESLLERALPVDARTAFVRGLVAWHLNELNGLQDQRRHLRETAPSTQDTDPARIKLREARCLDALRWDRAQALPAIWDLIDEVVETPADLYAPARALQALGEDPERLKRWRESLTDAQRQSLAQDGL